VAKKKQSHREDRVKSGSPPGPYSCTGRGREGKKGRKGEDSFKQYLEKEGRLPSGILLLLGELTAVKIEEIHNSASGNGFKTGASLLLLRILRSKRAPSWEVRKSRKESDWGKRFSFLISQGRINLLLTKAKNRRESLSGAFPKKIFISGGEKEDRLEEKKGGRNHVVIALFLF